MQYQNVYEKCPQHPNNDIILFCLAGQCKEPLCKECCKIHCEMHNQHGTRVEIDTVDNVKSNCIEEIHSLKMRFEEERAILHRFSDGEHSELMKVIHGKLDLAKQKLLKMVNDYCSMLEQQIRERLLEHRVMNQNSLFFEKARHPGEKKELHLKLNTIINNLDSQEKSLIQPKYMRGLLQVLTEEKNHDLEGVAQEIDKTVKHYLSGLFDVFIHEDKLAQIAKDLQFYVEIHEANLEEEIDIVTNEIRTGKKVYGVDKFGNPVSEGRSRVTTPILNVPTGQSKYGVSQKLGSSNNERLKNSKYDF